MARVFAGGREVDIPTDERGYGKVRDIYAKAKIPIQRVLVQQKSNGENCVVPKSGMILLTPEARFMDTCTVKRGCS